MIFLAAMSLFPGDIAPLAPQGDWTLDATPGICLVQRSYGAGALVLGLQLGADGERAELVLTQSLDASDATTWRGPVHIRLMPSDGGIDGTAESAVIDGGRITRISSLPKQFGGFDAANALIVDTGHGAPLAFGVNQLQKARDMLRRCHEALVRSWGIDPARFAPLGTGKVAASFFGPDRYPKAALRASEQGRAGVLIEIRPSGHAASCRVVETSHSESLNDATCDFALKRVTFTPAHDGSGKPTTSWTILSMRWVLPD